jgi:hypothetical protein
MTRRRITITIEVDDRPPYGADDLARDLLAEAAGAGDGYWVDGVGLVGARWVDTPNRARCMDAAMALHRRRVLAAGPAVGGRLPFPSWDELRAEDKSELAAAIEGAVNAGDLELPGAAWAPAPEHLAEIDRAGDLLMSAWTVIANAFPDPVARMASGSYGPERTAWAVAALRVQERFHAWLADHPAKAEVVPDCGAVSRAGTICYLSSGEAHDEHEGAFPAVVEVHDPDAGDVRTKALRLLERWK